MAKVTIDGQTLTLDDAICRENQSLKDALAPYYPAVANAEIKREKKDGEMVIKITKAAGTKGSYEPVLTALDKAPESISPLLVIEAAPPRSLPTKTLDDAIISMLEEENSIARVIESLETAEADSARIVPKGF